MWSLIFISSSQKNLWKSFTGFTFSIWSLIYLWLAASLVFFIVSIFISNPAGRSLSLLLPLSSPLSSCLLLYLSLSLSSYLSQPSFRQGLLEPPNCHACSHGHLFSQHGEKDDHFIWIWSIYNQLWQVLNLAWIFVWDRSSVDGNNGLTILAFFILISIALSNIAVIMSNKNYQLQSDSRYDYPM